jgi:uncharacterized membrane protein
MKIMGKKKKLSRAEERKKIYERKRKTQKKIIAAFIVIALICIGVFYVIASNNQSTNDKVSQSIVSSDVTVKIPLGNISSEADFYTHESDGLEIVYFVVKGSDDQIHVAIDACDVCYGAKKGYRQNGEFMHCINCGREFQINSIGTENTAGGCWPSYIPIKIDGEYVVIEKSDLEAKKYMFS